MRNKLLIACLLFVTAIAFAQKKEIKKADKAIRSGDFTEAMNLLGQAEALLDNADTDEKVSFYITRAKAYISNLTSGAEKLSLAGNDLNKALEIDPTIVKDNVFEETVFSLKQKMESLAIKDFNAKNYKGASDIYFAMYKVSKKDTVYLANAAISAKNGQHYEKAISYYEELINIGYTDIKKEYIATNKESGKIESFATKPERDLMLNAGTHILPGQRNTENKQDDFLNNLTVLYAETGKTEKALELMGELRRKDPNDPRLLRAEADLNLKIGNMERYQKLITELIMSDPNNPELFFNLGVTSYKGGNVEKAKEYYSKAIELDPDYAGAHINMASMILDQQKPIVTEMNGLGSSNADYKRYDELKAQLTDLQRSSIPYLVAAMRLRPNDVDFARSLMNIYIQVGEDAKAEVIKAKISELEGN